MGSELENRLITDTIERFLWRQEKEKLDIFLLRYWYFESIQSICRRTGYSQSKVTSMLFSLRRRLRECLEREGIEL